MSFGAALLAMSAVKMVSEIGQGYVKKSEANYNATVLEGQASQIQAQSEIEYGQYQRDKSKMLSKTVANVGASGIGFGGSALALAIENERQANIDQAIGQYNYRVQEMNTRNQAAAVRRQGRQAVTAGYTNAFSTALSGVSSYMMYNQRSSFDMGGGGTSQYGNVYGKNTPKGTIDMGSWSKFYFSG